MRDQASLSSFHKDIGIPIYFQEESGLVTFCSSELRGPLELSRDMRPPVQMRRGTGVFSRFSTGDSDIPSSCEMKEEPAFKPLQGNLTFFRVRESRNPLHLRQQTQGPSHIPIAEGTLLLTCLWKVGQPLQWNPGNQLTFQDYMGCMELSSSSCAEIGVPIDLRWLYQGISGVA